MKNLVLTIIALMPFLLVAQTNNKNTFKVRKERSEEVYPIVENMPEFPGGETALFQFIGKNLKFPKTLLDSINNDDGKYNVYIQFIVDTLGNITDIKPLRGDDLLVDEAIRVIKLMPKWIPGKNREKKVNVSFVLPFIFKID